MKTNYGVVTLFALAGFALPAQAETEFRGALCFASVSAACQADGWNAGACFQVRFAPRTVGANGLDTELSMFDSTFAVGFQLPSGSPVSSSLLAVDAAKVARGGYTYPLSFRFTAQNPAAPTTTTPSIIFNGVFTNWDEIAGCTVNFRASTTRQ